MKLQARRSRRGTSRTAGLILLAFFGAVWAARGPLRPELARPRLRRVLTRGSTEPVAQLLAATPVRGPATGAEVEAAFEDLPAVDADAVLPTETDEDPAGREAIPDVELVPAASAEHVARTPSRHGKSARPRGGRRTGSRRSMRTFVLVAIVAAMALGGGAGSFAAFRAATNNNNNNVATGTVQLVDNDAGAALFSLSNQQPNSTQTKCITVTSQSSLDSAIRFYASGQGGTLAPYISVKITRGKFTSAQTFPSCTGFAVDGNNYMTGQSPGVVYAGTFDSFPTGWSDGVRDPSSTAPASWVNGEAHAYKIELAVGDNRTAESKTAAPTFTWEAQNTASPAGTGYANMVAGTSGIVSFWRLGEAAGTTATDSVGSNNGTYTGGYTLGATGALANDTNKAATFNGSTGYVNVPNSSSLNVGNALSYEAWVKSTALGTYRPILSKGSFTLEFNSSNRLELIDNSDLTYATANVATADTAWHHVVGTSNGAGVQKLYIDGVDRTGTTTSFMATPPTTKSVYIGRVAQQFAESSFDWANATIDEPALYNRALTPTEVAAHYAAAN